MKKHDHFMTKSIHACRNVLEADMLEKDIEKKFTKAVKDKGGLALKFVSPGHSGVPDRIVLVPGGKVVFVELKATGKKLRPLQEKAISEIIKRGSKVYVIDSVESIKNFMGCEFNGV